MRLETERLIICPIGMNHTSDIFEYRSDAITNKYQGWIPETTEDVEVFIRKSAIAINEPESWFQLVLEEKKLKKVIGDIGLHFFGTENQQVEIGFTLHKDFQQKGYATEAVEKVISFLFHDLKKHRIIASVDPENINSIRLLERLKFRKEAHFRKSLFWKGEWVDDVIYALLETDRKI